MRRPLRKLETVARRREAIREREQAVVVEAKIAGASWGDIAAALGDPKQSVYRRYHDAPGMDAAPILTAGRKRAKRGRA